MHKGRIHGNIFTFHNVSINTKSLGAMSCHSFCFTFHNVSINTSISFSTSSRVLPLHSTMFLLIRRKSLRIIKTFLPLHSTMFLLIRFLRCHQSYIVNTLHSTMFLLIPLKNITIFLLLMPLHSTMFLLIRGRTSGQRWHYRSFTFHNVSINTTLLRI